ncbi:hypothetical protein GGE65_006660 [Skermanella aerolata]|jgi:hypothetical protein|uniref:Uncharacterized protein n=1 Tax=Skermanella aerolata TaxID=393310 RepID=A0A512DYJ8_9PROT|nr:hypothetical protein [Skermanella aerolata]KJB93100.1 hypothetical protein N826_18820 [Skermanella aerolata KACC 11604]GEO41567.1 hypothetical protein SAE02_57150 [Skermanella aerolata]
MPGINVPDSRAADFTDVEAVKSESEIVKADDCVTAAKSALFDTPPANFRIGIAKGRFIAPDDIDTDKEFIEKLFIA